MSFIDTCFQQRPDQNNKIKRQSKFAGFDARNNLTSNQVVPAALLESRWCLICTMFAKPCIQLYHGSLSILGKNHFQTQKTQPRMVNSSKPSFLLDVQASAPSQKHAVLVAQRSSHEASNHLASGGKLCNLKSWTFVFRIHIKLIQDKDKKQSIKPRKLKQASLPFLPAGLCQQKMCLIQRMLIHRCQHQNQNWFHCLNQNWFHRHCHRCYYEQRPCQKQVT